jgi:outer membrane immunogenic protein
MKNAVSALTLFSALVGGAAYAADLPSRKAPPPPFTAPEPVALWTGFYVGLNAGGTFGGSQSASISAGDLLDAGPVAGAIPGAAFAASASNFASLNNSGFIGGGQIGYNYQFNRNFVAGVEADIQGVTGSGSASVVGVGLDSATGATPVTTTQIQKSLDYLGTVRGRVGYLFMPTLLLYTTGGLAYGGANFSANVLSLDLANIYGPGFGSSSYSDTRVGWTVGGGVEWMFIPNWSAKLEYLYYDLGSATTPGAYVAGANAAGALQWAYGSTASTRFNGNVVRAGVNYHFNWGAPAPVIAKY